MSKQHGISEPKPNHLPVNLVTQTSGPISLTFGGMRINGKSLDAFKDAFPSKLKLSEMMNPNMLKAKSIKRAQQEHKAALKKAAAKDKKKNV